MKYQVGFLRLMAYQPLWFILLEEQLWYYFTHSWEDKEGHTFPKGICPKVNVIARLEYKLAYYDSVVHRFNQYTTRTPPWRINPCWLSYAKSWSYISSSSSSSYRAGTYILDIKFVWFSLFNGISTFCRLFNAKAILLVEEQ